MYVCLNLSMQHTAWNVHLSFLLPNSNRLRARFHLNLDTGAWILTKCGHLIDTFNLFSILISFCHFNFDFLHFCKQTAADFVYICLWWFLLNSSQFECINVAKCLKWHLFTSFWYFWATLAKGLDLIERWSFYANQRDNGSARALIL